MSVLDTAADTWGISGPDFLLLYIPVAIAAVVAAIWLRRGVMRRDEVKPRLEKPGAELSAPELGLLIDDNRPVLAALALLRAENLIGSDGTPARAITAGDRSRLDPFTGAVYDRIAAGTPVKVAVLAVAVAPDLKLLRAGLVERGYMPHPAFRRELRDAAMPVLIVWLLGLVRFIAGIVNGNGVGFLLALLITLAFVGFMLIRVPRVTALGRAATTEAVIANGYLRPQNAPSYETYGLHTAALGAALFGGAALLTFDAGLAGAAEPPASSSGWDSGGSGGDSGSSCGGGGGCGGGGCGG
ncbi:TIGR04222 domain-containing membrane protein [Nocardia jiangsuensis]|uniref:TIGR04222 domain-containing membrane protein n=1 Tax=Nocardia jiangsuensis TaxID=1691563 RepID=A0ABV8DV50_9NOCA